MDYQGIKINNKIIVVERTDKSKEYTAGSFCAIGPDGFDGYTIERPGPPSSIPNLNKPIPYGLYDTCERAEGDYAGAFAFRIWNQGVPVSRGILGHVGNKASDSSGCILFGLGHQGNGKITKSKKALNRFKAFYRDKKDVKLIVK